MYRLGWHYLVWKEVEGQDAKLRARCKAHLDRLLRMQPGVPSGLRLEKVHSRITELKISWNRQEYRFLFFQELDVIYIVNYFQKKTRAIPASEIDLAVARMREIQLERSTAVGHSLH
jgi:phage-related protein